MARDRTLVALAGLAAIVGGAVWWDQRRPSTDDRARGEGKLMPDFDRKSLSALTITHAGVTTELERGDGDEWWVKMPHHRADGATIDALTGELEFGRLERTIVAPDAATRALTGVDQPRATLKAGGLTLAIGADAPAGRGVYAARAGDRDVWVIDRRLLELTDRAPESFVSPRLVLGAVDAARTITLGAVTLERTGASFRLTQPTPSLAGDEKIAALVKSFEDAKAARFLPSPVAGAAPANALRVSFDGVEQARLDGPCPGHPGETAVTRSDGAVACFADATLASLHASAAELRELRPFTVGLDDITGFDLAWRDRELHLRRQDAAWRIVAPLEAAGPADDPAVRAWLKELLATRATGFTPAAKPLGSLRLFTADGEQRITVGLGAVEARSPTALAQRAGEPDALQLPASLLDLLEASPARFRSRELWSFRRSDVTALRIEDESAALSITHSDAGYRALPPAKIELDPQALDRLLEVAATLHAAEFAPARSFRPRRTISLTVDSPSVDAGASPPPPYGVELGPRDPDGRCPARLPGTTNPTLLLAAPDCAALSAAVSH